MSFDRIRHPLSPLSAIRSIRSGSDAGITRLPTIAVTASAGMPRSQTSTAAYAAPASTGLGRSFMGRVKSVPASVLPFRTGHPAPDAMTARAKRPDGTSNVGATRVNAARDEVGT